MINVTLQSVLKVMVNFAGILFDCSDHDELYNYDISMFSQMYKKSNCCTKNVQKNV